MTTPQYGWNDPEEHKPAMMAFGMTAATLLMNGAGKADWDAFVIAVKKARAAGVPWEILVTPRPETQGSRYAKDRDTDPFRLAAVLWGGVKEHLIAQRPLALAVMYSAKAARALLRAGAPITQLQMQTEKSSQSSPIITNGQEAAAWALGLIGRNGRVLTYGHHDKTRVGTTVVAEILIAAAKFNKGEHAEAIAKMALDWGREMKKGLWLNREGCTDGEALAAKEALWAQEVATAIMPLERIDPEWAKDALKVAAKAKVSGGEKEAVAARKAESAAPEHIRRWPMALLRLESDDLDAWIALERLSGLDEEKGLNASIAPEMRGAPGGLWLTQALRKGALKIAARALERGANPWLIGPDALDPKDPNRLSPLAGMRNARSPRRGGQNFAHGNDDGQTELGLQLGAALLRDAKKVEPSEAAARELVKKELDERMAVAQLPAGIRAGMEAWSIKASLGANDAQTAESNASPKKSARRM